MNQFSNTIGYLLWRYLIENETSWRFWSISRIGLEIIFLKHYKFCDRSRWKKKIKICKIWRFLRPLYYSSSAIFHLLFYMKKRWCLVCFVKIDFGPGLRKSILIGKNIMDRFPLNPFYFKTFIFQLLFQTFRKLTSIDGKFGW